MEQSDLLRLAVCTLQQLGIPYAIVGSFASGAWGESRFTLDIDIVIDLNPLQVDDLCDAFPSEHFYVSKPAAEEAVRLSTQFNVIHPTSGNKIDFMIAGKTDWARAQLIRCRSVLLFDDIKANFAAPEDVILGKLIYYREGGSDKHLRDITGILKVSSNDVDYEYLKKFATKLGVSKTWQELLGKLK